LGAAGAVHIRVIGIDQAAFRATEHAVFGVRRAEVAARDALRKRQKDISEAALGELIERAGFNARQLDNEIEKLCLYVGERKKIELADVSAICSRNKTAKAFALGDALGSDSLGRWLYPGVDMAGAAAAYRKALESKSYESVLHISGKKERAYALTNPMEYFAEQCAEPCALGLRHFAGRSGGKAGSLHLGQLQQLPVAQ